MSPTLKTVELKPQNAPHRASVIWMHGLGASGYDFLDIIKLLHLPENLGIKFIFPHAPIMPIQFMDGEEMRAWFDIVQIGSSIEDEPGIKKSQIQINELITQEMALGIPSNKIILVGFSQGGAMALQCGLRFQHQLAGILVLSAWLPLANTVSTEKAVANLKTPILMLHGTHDQIVKPEWATESYNDLIKLGYDIQLKSYAMQHTICPDEIKTISLWLNELLQ